MAFDRPRRSGLEYGFALVTTASVAPVIYFQYVRQCIRHSRQLAHRNHNRVTFAVYVVAFVLCFPVFLLMPSYRRQVHDEMGGR